MKTKHAVVFPGFFLFGLIVFFPALSSYFFTDDFEFLAISRYISNPLAFFNNDHFPGSSYYRPLGMLWWWLTYKLFGIQYVLHNLLNMLIHIGNTYVLFRVFSLIRADFRLNILLALLFLVHPLTTSTSMWLSDRFDLLATWFILLTIYWFLRYRLEGTRVAYFSALATCILASLSKELAYFTPLIVTIVAWYIQPDAIRTWRTKLSEIAPFYVAILLVFTVRYALLRGTEKLLLGDNSLFTVLLGGAWRWLNFLPDLYAFYTDFSQWNITVGILLPIATLILAGLSLLALPRLRGKSWGVITLGLTIILVPAVLQAPVTFTSFADHSKDGFAIVNLVNSRLYYLSFVGVLLIAQQLLTAAGSTFINPKSNLIVTRLVYFLLFAQIITYGALSYLLCHGWSKLTNGLARIVVEQTSLALEPLSLPKEGCKLYILNTPDSPSDSLYFRDESDSIIKAMAPKHSQIIHCLVLTEKTPWFQLMLREDLKTMQAAPLRNAIVAGQPFPPTLIDNLAFVYLNMPDSVEAALDPNAMFIEFDGQKFVDVSQQVRSGSKKINLFSVRP